MAKKKRSPRTEQVGARLTEAQRTALDEIAKLKDLGPSELVRLYVLQGIGADREAMETAGTILPSTRPKA